MENSGGDDMKEEHTLPVIVGQWLVERGYDGLCLPLVECGCGLDDFMPCGEPGTSCEAAYKDEDGMYRPGKRPGAEDDK
jgi:hypothetical protein